jgi:uncharacterized protein (TIGR00255 family)
MPPELESLEVAARQLIRKKLIRGHVQVGAHLEVRGPADVRVQRHLVQGYLAAYRQLAEEHGVTAEPDLNAVFRLPGIVTWGGPGDETPDGVEKALLGTLDEALEALARMREREAEGIVEEMQRRSKAIDAALDRVEQIREGLTARLADRLAQKLSELLRAAALDPQRILQEAAFLAERSDIGEEIQRLRQHNRQLRDLLTASGEVGKKLDFLLQEMNREANTIVSKTSGIGEPGLEITDLGLALKAEIEKIREQAMNLE